MTHFLIYTKNSNFRIILACKAYSKMKAIQVNTIHSMTKGTLTYFVCIL